MPVNRPALLLESGNLYISFWIKRVPGRRNQTVRVVSPISAF
jgi:hypothetical protein